MRAVWFSVLLAAFAACSSERVGPPPPAPVNWQSLDKPPGVDAGGEIVTARERGIPDAYVAALASVRFERLAPLLDEDAHFASPGAADGHGRADVVSAHDRLLGAFEDRKVALGRVWRTPSEQTIEWTMTATQARDWGSVPATHKTVAFRGLTLLWTKDDGSVTDLHVYVNTAVVKAQLGVGPKELLALPPAPPPAGSAQVLEQTPDSSQDERAKVDVVKSALDALENNRESAYVAAMTDDLEVDAQDRAPVRGKEGAKAYYRAMHKAIGQLDTTVADAWGVAQFAIVEYSISGEQLGPLAWIPARRDTVISLQLVDICEVREGRIARVWRYDNPAQILGETP